jgi:mRNA-degrading endonuclease toxin of MazEF toxin-antitoxin module
VIHGQTIRQGDIFWLDECPPLEGEQTKRRPVIVVSPPEMLKGVGPVLVVATSTTVLVSEMDRVALPNKQNEPQTKSGLPRPCWAVPRWFLLVERTRLTEYAGYVTGDLLRRLTAAVEKRIAEASGNA